MIRLFSAAAVLAFSALLAFGCSSGGDDENAGTGGGANGPGDGFGFSGSGGKGGAGSGTSSCFAQDDSGCVGEQYAGESIPLDIYIMFDRSCSMSCDIDHKGCCKRDNPEEQGQIRIEPIREALSQFLNDPKSVGMGAGIGYFGHQPGGQTTCDASGYSAAEVPIAPLPGNTAALTQSINNAEPTGETPTAPAIRGACSYATEWKRQNPGRAVVILLVTDGVPETPDTNCWDDANEATREAIRAAEECATAEVPIKTYVLGVGKALSTLNSIARAGGTNQAYLVEGGDVSSAVLSALNAIRGDATIPCEFRIPPAPDGATLDLNLVNVGVCDAGGDPKEVFYAPSPDDCGDKQGWYLDNGSGEPRIRLCQASCETVSVPGAELYYTVGCERKPIPVE